MAAVCGDGEGFGVSRPASGRLTEWESQNQQRTFFVSEVLKQKLALTSSLLLKSRWLLMLFVWHNPAYPAHSPLITFVVPHGEVGVVSRLWGQAVVEVLAVTWVVLVHCTHCLDHLWGDERSGELEPKEGASGPKPWNPVAHYFTRW